MKSCRNVRTTSDPFEIFDDDDDGDDDDGGGNFDYETADLCTTGCGAGAFPALARPRSLARL